MKSDGYKANLLFLEAPPKGTSHYPYGEGLSYVDEEGGQGSSFHIDEERGVKTHTLSSEEIIEKLIRMFKGQIINTHRGFFDKRDCPQPVYKGQG